MNRPITVTLICPFDVHKSYKKFNGLLQPQNHPTNFTCVLYKKRFLVLQFCGDDIFRQLIY